MSDDLGQNYLLKRTAAPGALALDELLARVDATPPGGQDAPPTKPQEQGGVGAVAKDIGRGIVEAPKQIAGGVNDAVVNALKMADPLVEWLEKNVAELPRYEIPTVDKPDSVTGGIVREGARFVTGFVPAFKAMRGIGLGVTAASVAGGALSEATTADPTSEGLFNLIESVPSLKNPVTEFLATNPDDPEALNRLKKGVEGAGFGLVGEGVFQGIRAIAKSVGKTKLDPLTEMKLKYGEVKDEDFAVLGDMKKPAIFTQKADKAVKATKDVEPTTLTEIGESEGSKVYVNFARIDTADDVKNLIAKTTNIFAKDIDEARRGVQSNVETSRLAEELGMTVGDLLSRRKGQGFNAEEGLAARRLWAASSEKLLEAAKKASSPNAGAVDQFNFRKIMATHYAIQSEVIGARTETARALQAWAIPAGGGVEKARAIQQLMDASGGSPMSQDMAKRLAKLYELGADQAAVNAAVRKGWGATTKEMVQESFVHGLLWSPSTHIVNTASNTAFAVMQIGERSVAGAIGQGVVEGEAMAMTYGLVTSLRDAFRAAGKSIRTGETGSALGKVDLPRDPAISTEAIARERGLSVAETEAFRQSMFGKAVDFIGESSRIPGRVLGAEDEFFKTIGYRAELHAQAVRQATEEGLKGPDRFRRMAEIVQNPPENIRLAAADAALYNTFTNQPGEIAQAVMKVRQAGTMNPTFLFLPFLRTPANLLNRSFERTPIAPLMASFRADIAAGGARSDLAMARMATGTAAMLTIADLAYSGLVTGAGPDDPGEKEALQRQGWQEFSVKVGDKWVSYKRTDPFGLVFGTAATMAEMAKRFDLEPDELDEWQEIAGAAAGAMAKSVVNKTYFEGISRVIDAISSADQNPQAVANVINQVAGSMMPFGSALGTVERAVDPTVREFNSPWEYVQSRLAGMSSNMKPARDLWGKEKKPHEVFGRAYDVLSPFTLTKAKDSPIDAEMTRLNMDVRRIPSKADFDGVPMNLRDFPDVKDAYERLAGNELKHPAWGLGAKDYLDQVVSGKHSMSVVYESLRDGEDGGKASFIKDAIGQYRRLARNKILNDPDFRDFRDEWDVRRLDAMQKKLPQ